jgi:hypothetical protein
VIVAVVHGIGTLKYREASTHLQMVGVGSEVFVFGLFKLLTCCSVPFKGAASLGLEIFEEKRCTGLVGTASHPIVIYRCERW